MSIYPDLVPFAMAFVGCTSFLTGFLVLIRKRDQVGFWYFMFSFFVFIWAICLSAMCNNELVYETAEFWGRISNASAILIGPTWLHFVIKYTRIPHYFFRISLYIFYLISCFLLVFWWTDLAIPYFQQIAQFNYYPFPGPLYYLFTLLFYTTVPLAFLLLFQSYQTTNDKILKRQNLYLILASLYGFGVGGLSFLPVYGFDTPQYNLLLMPLWQIALAYIMVEYKILDAHMVVETFRKDKLAAIGTISSSINHEIRGPLYVVHGLAQSFIEKVSDKQDSDVKSSALTAMQKISEQSVRAMDIIKRFSSFAKQNVDAEFKSEPVSLKEVLKTVNPLVEHELDSKNIVLKEEIASNLPSIQADPRHLEEILFNLIVNAAQAIASLEKGGEIVIKAYAEKGAVILEVIDSGPGIAAEELDRVFEPFHTSKAEGTGLGLYITKQLVEKNSGKISIQSTLGIQTIFKIKFKSI